MPTGTQNSVVQALAQQLAGTIVERSQRENPAVIEGYVYLKRKQDWVKRYASVANSVFSYKKQKSDKETRNFIDLKRSQIKYSARIIQGGDNYIKIDAMDKLMVVDLRFGTLSEYDDWLQCLRLNSLWQNVQVIPQQQYDLVRSGTMVSPQAMQESTTTIGSRNLQNSLSPQSNNSQTNRGTMPAFIGERSLFLPKVDSVK